MNPNTRNDGLYTETEHVSHHYWHIERYLEDINDRTLTECSRASVLFPAFLDSSTISLHSPDDSPRLCKGLSMMSMGIPTHATKVHCSSPRIQWTNGYPALYLTLSITQVTAFGQPITGHVYIVTVLQSTDLDCVTVYHVLVRQAASNPRMFSGDLLLPW